MHTCRSNTSAAPGAGIVVADDAVPRDGGSLHAVGCDGDRDAVLGSGHVRDVNPAVTLRSVGTAGGQAAAFAYDLAKSVVYTRQGNPAWSGQERDGQTPIRSDDSSSGAARRTGWI